MFPVLPLIFKRPVTIPVIFCILTGTLSGSMYDSMYEREPISYSATQPKGPVAELQSRLESGETVLDASSERALVRSLLNAFDIPVESQVLVFSKTSHQNSRITPETPRAIYFNEEVYLGWVQGGVVEVADMSPGLGMTFHIFDPQTGGQTLRFNRTASCLDCHAGSRVNNLPGLVVRSVYPDSDGRPILSEGSFLTGHSSPLEERWGGWYVTGTHGKSRHMGNIIAEKKEHGIAMDLDAGANQKSLQSFFNTDPYLRGTSDIVALMVLEHQTEMHNALTHGAAMTRLAMHRSEMLRKELGEAPSDTFSGSTLRVLEGQAEKIVHHLLFTTEIQLPEGGIQGDPAFQKAFLSNARKDSKGKSLKDFDLNHRLFKHRCSYMIHSSAFDDLPSALKSRVYRRLIEILKGRDTSGEYTHLTGYERMAILNILSETKDDWPE